MQKKSHPEHIRVLYRNNLKNWEFDKETVQNFSSASDAEQATIAEWQGASEHENFEKRSTQSKPNSSGYFGIQALNQRGIIPGPTEDEEGFFKRVDKIEKMPAIQGEIPIDSEAWAGVYTLTRELFDFAPDWIRGFYSNRHLSLWQAAAMWITDKESQPIIQLKMALRAKPYLGVWQGMYKKDEILAHESVHAVRSTFDEPIFEELLAYQTSRSRFRRWIGPLFRTNFESCMFMGLIALSFTVQVISSFYDFFEVVNWVHAAPLVAFGYGMFRLWGTQAIFHKAKQRVGEWIKRPDQALAVLVRLTDQEIRFFSTCHEKERKEYILKQQQISLRWQMIIAAYFNDGF